MRVRGFVSSRFRPPAPLVEVLINVPSNASEFQYHGCFVSLRLNMKVS